ncbi:MAG: insulinase family protein [Acidobacteria bacterium]|nr:insulinase family protein [Acidobacteriota bacterium]
MRAHSLASCVTLFFVLFAFAVSSLGQETPPQPSAPRSVKIPVVTERKLPNGLTVVVVERHGAPLISVRMMFNSGVTSEDIASAGLVKMTTNLLSKGTATRSATRIANDIEFLGADISTSVALDSSSVSLGVTSDKIGPAMTIFADVIRRPTFPASEIKLAQSQAIDELTYNLKQPSFLANYVATAYTFNGNPASGTPESLKAMKREDILEFFKYNIEPNGATLLFVGDISPTQAMALARTHFGTWKSTVRTIQGNPVSITETAGSVQQRKDADRDQPLVKRMLVIDLPGSGQAAVSYAKQLQFAGRVDWNEGKRATIDKEYFPGVVMNSLLGGGYSSRLNQEIRIKRGLSYGAGSSITWRAYDSRFSTRTQTKNESAPEVVELVLEELKRLAKSNATAVDVGPRQAALIGDFGRSLETNSSMIGVVADLYDLWLDPSELDRYMSNVQSVSSDQIRAFAAQHLNGGDIIIVGDYSIFKDDLAKRFPGMKIDVVKADELDLSKDNLRK